MDVTRDAISLDAFRDDGFVQDHIMPLRQVPMLTPRSEESLRRQGLVVEEIMPQFGPAYSIDASKLGGDPFEEESLPKDIIEKRIGRQEQKRRELIEMLVWEREKIISEGPGKDLSDLNLGGDDSSSALQAERNKVVSMQNRQKVKMEQALLHELRTQQAESLHLVRPFHSLPLESTTSRRPCSIALPIDPPRDSPAGRLRGCGKKLRQGTHAQENLAEMQRRADRETAARVRRKREIENEKREKEMGKKAQDEVEGKMRRKQALEQYDREQEMSKLEKLKEKARQREVERRNAELKEKQEMHKRELQMQYEKELRAQQMRQLKMQEKERERLDKLRMQREETQRQQAMAAQVRRKSATVFSTSVIPY